MYERILAWEKARIRRVTKRIPKKPLFMLSKFRVFVIKDGVVVCLFYKVMRSSVVPRKSRADISTLVLITTLVDIMFRGT